MNHSILCLSQEDVRACRAATFHAAVAAMEQVFVSHHRGDFVLPHKAVLRWGGIETENTRGRLNAMPAFVGGSIDMAGMKWIGSFPRNRDSDNPRGTAVVVVNDPQTGFPLCIMDGTYLSALRTAATNLLAARYLCRPDPTTLGLVGAGVQVRFHLKGFLETYESLRRVAVYNRTRERAERLADICAEHRVELVCVESPGEAIRSAEVVVSSTTTNEPLITGTPFRAGATYFHFSGNECSAEAISQFDRIYVDDWATILHRGNLTPAVLHRRGRFDESRISGSLGELVAGCSSRPSESDTTMFCAIGMALEDVALATLIYREANSRNLGTRVHLWRQLAPLLQTGVELSAPEASLTDATGGTLRHLADG